MDNGRRKMELHPSLNPGLPPVLEVLDVSLKHWLDLVTSQRDMTTPPWKPRCGIPAEWKEDMGTPVILLVTKTFAS